MTVISVRCGDVIKLNHIFGPFIDIVHDFAEILRRLFLLWRHSFVTWPDPTKFFSPKVPQRMLHKLWKISTRSSKRCGVQLRKTHGGVGCINPPDRARVNPRPAGPLDFPPPAAGGGGVWTPPMISAPGRRREKRKAAFKSSRKIISKSFRSFFGSW